MSPEQIILAAAAAGKIPVVAPLAVGPLNVNADDAAAALALGSARGASSSSPTSPGCTSTTKCSTRSTSTARRARDAGEFEGGIVPKLRAAALAAGSGIAAEIGRTAVIA